MTWLEGVTSSHLIFLGTLAYVAVDMATRSYRAKAFHLDVSAVLSAVSSGASLSTGLWILYMTATKTKYTIELDDVRYALGLSGLLLVVHAVTEYMKAWRTGGKGEE